TLSIANTGIHAALPVKLVLSPGAAVRDHSQYNETSYSDFAISQASLFDGVRPTLPGDGKVLQFNLGIDPHTQTDIFTFNGSALFEGSGKGSIGGVLLFGLDNTATGSAIDVTAPDAAPVAGYVSISSAAINAFNAPTVMIGGGTQYNNDTSY